MPERATIQARDGTPIAKGPERTSDLGPIASEIAGNIGPRRPSWRRSSRPAASRRARRSG